MAAKRNRSTSTILKHQAIPTGICAILILLGLFLVVAPFQMGFFNGTGLHGTNQFAFEDLVMYGSLFGMAGMILAGCLIYRRGTIERRHVLAIAGAILPLLYWMSSWHAASPYLAEISLVLIIACYAFFLMGIFLSESNKALRIFQHIYIAVGYLVVLYGFLILFGVVYIQDSLSFDIGVRLASVFTYSNANAAFLIVLLLASLLRITNSIHKAERYIHAFMLVPVASSLMMTLSRGAMLVLPVIAIVTLIMLYVRRQLTLIGYFSLSMLLSLAIIPDLMERGTQTYDRYQSMINAKQPIETVGFFSKVSLGGWTGLLVAGLAMVCIVYSMQRYAVPWIQKQNIRLLQLSYSRFYIPVTMVLLCCAGFGLLASGVLSGVLPTGLTGRINNFSLHTHSVLERLTMYRDALQIWKEQPLFGGGGGNWEARYEQFQSYPYVSAQPHSYAVQLLVEVGIIGLIVVVVLFLYLIINYLRNYFAQQESQQETTLFYFLMTSSILLHSLIDFEMSYLYFAALVFLGMGVLAGGIVRRTRWLERIEHKLIIRRVAGTLMAVIGIIGLSLIVGKLTAIGHYRQSVEAAETRKPLDAIVNPVASGLGTAPGHPFLLDRIITYNLQAYKQSSEVQYLEAAKRYAKNLNDVEPNFKNSTIRQYEISIVTGEREQAVQILQQAIDRAPYELTYYQQIIADRFALWLNYRNNGQLDEAHKDFEALQAVMSQLQSRIIALEKVPDVISYIRRFEITPKMYLTASQMYYFEGQFQQAQRLLAPVVSGSIDSDEQKNITLFYLASLRKLGQDDQALYDKLTSIDPKFGDRLNEIMKQSHG